MNIAKVVQALDASKKRQMLALLILLSFVSTIELLGLGSILPFLAVIGNRKLIYENIYLSKIYTYFGCINEQSFITLLGIGAFLFIIFSSAIKLFGQFSLYRFIHMARHSIATKLLNNYLLQKYVYFTHRNSSEMIKTLHGDAQIIVNTSFAAFVRFVSSVYTVLLISMVMMLLQPLLTICVVSVLGILYYLFSFFVERLIEDLGNAYRHNNLKMHEIATEAFGSFKETKICNKEGYWVKLFADASIKFAKSFSLMQTISMAPKFIIEATCFGGILAIATYYAHVDQQASKNMMPILAFYAFAGYRLLPAIQSIFNAFATMKYNSKVLDDTLADLSLEIPSEYKISRQIQCKLSLKKSLEFVNVCFSYKDCIKPVLNNINVKIKANTSLGIVGKTGTGKSTFIDVLIGLFEATSGQILIDDNALTKDNILAWRNNIGYVSQATSLLDTTIRSNIAFGVVPEDIDDERVVKAAKLAQIHSFISNLEKGYYALIGEQGVRISGGQKQRLGVARALYDDPDILVFDEATSALDEETEQALIASVDALKKFKTIIMISHRPSTLKNCTQILRL